VAVVSQVRPVDPTAPAGFLKRALMRASNTAAGRSVGIRFAAKVDPFLLRISGGRVATTAFFPVVTLITRGRRSGEERQIPLVYFTRGDEVILIASSFGREKNPAWYYNATATPGVELLVKGERLPYVVRETEGDEREHLLDLAERLYPGYGDYRRRTAGIREIPVLALRPGPTEPVAGTHRRS
jgi:deazaflavin-dependent oxidoreductase (nitroreductase family)